MGFLNFRKKAYRSKPKITQKKCNYTPFPLTGTSLLNSLTGPPLTGLLVNGTKGVPLMNFVVYSVPVNRTLVNGTVPITGNTICPVNGNIVY